MPNASPVLSADTHVHRLYAEHAGMPVGVVTQCAQHASALAQAVWQECRGASWAAKAEEFFTRHEEALFELLHNATTRAQRRAVYVRDGLWPLLTGAEGGSVLDFGGGLGLTASLLRDTGRSVTYCDVEGPASRFAAWYFATTGHDVEVVHTPFADAVLPAGREWDVVIAESVLEHVPDAAATAERLAAAVRPGGMLVMTLERHAAPEGLPAHKPMVLADVIAAAPTLRAMACERGSPEGYLVFRRR